MANQMFNVAKAKAGEWWERVKNNDPANSAFIVVLLQVSEADATLIDYDDLGAILGAAGNTEATATNYVRKVLTDSELGVSPTPDDVNDRFDFDLPDQVYTALGGAVNNNLVKAILCYDDDTTSGTDANVRPVAHYDWAINTDGSDTTLNFDAAGAFRGA